MITVSRIVCAVLLLFTLPFSLFFWVLYGYGGISDLADGLVARVKKQQSELGARLDSVADAAFLLAIIIVVVPIIVIPAWLWIWVIVIGCIRVTAYLIGYKKYHVFSALHTYANKITGGLLFSAPVLCTMLGVTAAGIILCLFAVFSACEELLITVLSKELNHDRKSVFTR